MTLELVTVPCLSDNYAYLLHDAASGRTALVDAPEAEPIIAALDSRGWTLTEVLLTHHHWDHVDGLPPLKEAFHPKVIGAAADAYRLPPLDKELSDNEIFDLAGAQARVFDVPGHTVGHIAIHLPSEKILFTADSLMALGCGRLFEGTPDQMWDSLVKLRALPDDTVVCSGHEYTASNARFALTIETDNPDLRARAQDIQTARAAGKPTVPSMLGTEKRTNPFLRADLASVAAAVGLTGAPAASVFAEVRARKDRF